MQLATQLPFGILCILFAHYARVTAVCPTPPCNENVPVYGVAPAPLAVSSAPAAEGPVVSTTSPAVIVSSSQPVVPPGLAPPASSASTPILAPTTASSTMPMSTPILKSPAAKLAKLPSKILDEPTVASSQSPSMGGPIVPPPSTTASSVSSAASNTSASVSVPASITQCGSCRVLADQVQVYYWSTASVKNDCARGASVNPFQTGVPYASNASRIQSLAPQGADSPTTTVVDRYTFTFPSLYVSVIGGISVSDSCGLIGSVHTNPAPVAVHAITTASYYSWPSTCRPQGLNAEALIDTLALSDIACPTWGLSNPFTTSCDGSSYLTATYGEPYNPVILVPTEILAIDPAWGACTTNTADALLTLPCGIYDPPKVLQTAPSLVPGGGLPPVSDLSAIPESKAPEALQQADVLAPTVTPVNDPSDPTILKAEPASTGSPSLPEPTTASSSAGSAGDLLKLDPLDPGTKQSSDQSQSSPVEQGASNPDPGTSEDPSQSNPDQKEAPAPASESQDSDPNVQPLVPQAPTTINLGGEPSSTQGVGAFINGALGGGSVPAPTPSPAFTPHAVTALDQILSITDPSAVAIAGSTLSIGGPAHISDGKYYSLAASGNLVAGTLPSSPGPSSPLVLSVAGSIYTANSASAFVLAGQTLTRGGQIEFHSTPISLAPSAQLAVIGTSTQLLTTPAPTSNPAILTFAGSTYTANTASQFVIAGQTLAPGGTITASNTPISLPTGTNIAVIGTSTQTLATATSTLPTTEEVPILTWDGETYTADASSDFVIASQTLTPGGIITVLGTPIRLAPAANDVVIGSSTQSLSSSAVITPADVFTIGGQVITANPTGFAIAGTEILPGGKGVLVKGTEVSLATGGTLVLGNSSTVLPTVGPSAGIGTGAGVFEGGQGRLGGPGVGEWVVYTTFCIFLGVVFVVG